MDDRVEIYRNDAVRGIKALIKRDMTFDLIFLDPPYKQQQLVTLLEIIHEHRLLRPSGLVICEHASDIELPEEIRSFKKRKSEKYGIIAISIYMGEE